MKRKIILLSFVVLGYVQAFGCAVCERRQPKLFRGWVHGAGPDSNWDYFIVTLMALVVLATLFYSVKWLLKPGEGQQSHIKRMILNPEDHE